MSKPQPIVDRLKPLRHLALDMDGTLYLGRTLFEFTPAFLGLLDELGIGHTFLTNNCSRSVEDYVLKLRDFGINARPDEIYTSGTSTIDYLRTHLPAIRRLYVLGTSSLCREFADAGFTPVGDDEEPDAVIVSFDTHLTFDRLAKAAWWLQRGKTYIATHPDPTCPTDLPTVLVDCGSICACLEHATRRRPQAVLGKPSPAVLEGILARHPLQPQELAIVGDRLGTDMAMARSAGVLGVLVLTGATTMDDVRSAPDPPDLVVPNVDEFGKLLVQAKGCAR